MKTFDLTSFLKQYFKANHCHIEENDGTLTIQLTEEMDKKIMNRPFYWQYVKMIGEEGKPMTISYRTKSAQSNNDKTNAELIHFGSPKLHTIFNELKESAQFVRLFESVEVNRNTMLHPWLIVNLLVRYKGKQIKDELFSVGLQLINGALMFDMMDKLNTLSLSRTIPNYCYTISPLIKLESGFNRIMKTVTNDIQNRSYKWADESRKMLEEELTLINHFYDEDDENEKEREIKQAKERYEPEILFQPFNCGLFYLTGNLLRETHI